MNQERRTLARAIIETLINHGQAPKPETTDDFFDLLHAVEEGVEKGIIESGLLSQSKNKANLVAA